jgi:hypothetical protein
MDRIGMLQVNAWNPIGRSIVYSKFTMRIGGIIVTMKVDDMTYNESMF